MNDNIEQLLKNLRLNKIRDILDREIQWAVAHNASYADFLARLLREQFLFQQEQSIMYRIQQAKLPCKWDIDSFPFDKQPSINPAVIRQLAELDFIPRAENIVFIGATGVGKTGLASAILLKAIQNGYRGLFIKAQNLFDDMYASLADRSSRKLLNRLANFNVLLIDELGYLNLRQEQTNIFFKLMDERYQRKATIITTNLDYDEWYDFLGNKKMVGALLDRLRHHCHTIKIDGTSLRTPHIP